MGLLASVPYAVGKSYDFYDDRLEVEDSIMYYNDILGYAYLLTRVSNSVNFVPTHTTTKFTVYLDYGASKPFSFGRSSSAPLASKSSKQKTVELVYSEVVKLLGYFIAPLVYEKCIQVLNDDGYIMIGKLEISYDGLFKKTLMSKKSLPKDEYLGSDVLQGKVRVFSNDQKVFYSCSLSEMNAPLISPILNTIYSD